MSNFEVIYSIQFPPNETTELMVGKIEESDGLIEIIDFKELDDRLQVIGRYRDTSDDGFGFTDWSEPFIMAEYVNTPYVKAFTPTEEEFKKLGGNGDY